MSPQIPSPFVAFGAAHTGALVLTAVASAGLAALVRIRPRTGPFVRGALFVAIALVLAFELSTRMGLCPAEDTARVRRHLAAIGLPTGLGVLGGRALGTRALLDHMSRDKKVEAGHITFVLTRGIGEAFLSREVDPADVEAVLYSTIEV